MHHFVYLIRDEFLSIIEIYQNEMLLFVFIKLYGLIWFRNYLFPQLREDSEQMNIFIIIYFTHIVSKFLH
jgi:hypothetical protein